MRYVFERSRRSGFTLVEIAMVVLIIGLLVAIATPAFQKARLRSQVTNVVNDLKVFSYAFDLYSLERGGYPPESHLPEPWHLPNEQMEEYLDREKWKATTAIGGNYNWEGPDVYSYAGISVFDTPALLTTLNLLDEILDDGSLVSGMFKQMPNGRYTYLLDE